jgi:putative addiction module component (TIGR02574 family)
MDDATRVLTIALDLPEHQRAEIAARLLESLDGGDREGVDEAWEVEIERRCAALDSGEAVTSDWNEFRARMERDVALAHTSRKPNYWRSRLKSE